MAKERINRINEELHREIAGIVRELKDTRIPVMTSVVGVSVTNDLSYAKVYVSVMGNDEVQENALAGLRSAAGFVRREVGRRVQIRHTPEILFELDHSIEHGAHINDILKKL